MVLDCRRAGGLVHPRNRQVGHRRRTADALRALTHPLRLQLIALLGRTGPSTPSRLGREVGASSGSTLPENTQGARLVSLYLGAVPVLDDGTDW